MPLYYEDESVRLHHGDCIEVMQSLPDNSVDSIVTDPPYGLGFMGKGWDALPPGLEWAAECLRVLKPGGHLLAFGGTRTWHRLAVAVEDAGFEIRDSLAWLYGSGFPKSQDISKAIDKRGGNPGLAREIAEAIRSARESRGWTKSQADQHFCGGSTNWSWYEGRQGDCRPPTPVVFSQIVAEWPELGPLAAKVAEVDREVIGRSAHKSGIGNGTKGHYTVGGTVAQHVDITAPATEAAKRWQGWGTALKPAFEPVVMGRKPLEGTVAANVLEHGTGALNIDASRITPTDPAEYAAKGASVVGLGSNRNGAAYGEWKGVRTDSTSPLGRHPANVLLDEAQAEVLDGQADASRFFYVAKAPKSERPVVNGVAHETVKPLAIMRYLAKMVTPPGGTVLEPFAGSGTTVEACMLEGFNCIAIEREETYLPLIEARIERQQNEVESEPTLDIFGEAA